MIHHQGKSKACLRKSVLKFLPCLEDMDVDQFKHCEGNLSITISFEKLGIIFRRLKKNG